MLTVVVVAVSGDSDIQDAYVVATDDESHDNLQQLAALYKVNPVNIGEAYDNTAHTCDDSDTEDVDDAQLSTCSDPITNSPLPARVDKTESLNCEASPVLGRDLDTAKRNVHTPMETSVVNGFGPGPGHVTGSPAMHAPGENMYVNLGNGPHREMAIDCPENFVGSLKEPPRYPPPQPVNSSQSSLRSQHGTPSKVNEAKRHANDPSAGIAAMQQPSKTGKEEDMEHRIKMYEVRMTMFLSSYDLQARLTLLLFLFSISDILCTCNNKSSTRVTMFLIVSIHCISTLLDYLYEIFFSSLLLAKFYKVFEGVNNKPQTFFYVYT